MNGQRRLEPLKRGSKKRSGSWADVQAPHPGVRDPRSVRVADWPPLVNAAIIATCAFVTALAVISASLASPVGPVEKWDEWSSKNGEIRLEHPSGWAVTQLGTDQQIHLVIVRSQWVRIHVIAESGLGNALAAYRLTNRAARYRLLEAMHRSTAQTWEEQVFGEFSEGATGRTIIGGRPAVWSQFKYDRGYLENDVPMAGYRATIIGDNRSVIAGAVAPAADWDEFKPIALRVLKSIRFGRGAG